MSDKYIDQNPIQGHIRWSYIVKYEMSIKSGVIIYFLKNIHAIDVNSLRLVRKKDNYRELDTFQRIMVHNNTCKMNTDKDPISKDSVYNLL